MFFIRSLSYTQSVPRFDMPTSSNLNLFWCSGSVAGMAMSIQLMSGIICSMNYMGFMNSKLGLVHYLVAGPGLLLDKFSMELLRFMHLWGASLLFVCLFIYMVCGLYYCSYSKNPIMWSLGVAMYVANMAEAFMGYLLLWHQMSYWAGVVMSSIFLSLPFFGPHLYSYLLGSYDFGSMIISRVFVVHVVFGFVMLFLIILHMVSLHKIGSSDSFNSSDSYSDSIYFHNLYIRKDLFVWLFVILITLVLTCHNPWLTNCKENFMVPNSLSTPTKIKPEWYFLPFYAMLRSMENKIGGLLAVVLVLFLFWLPSPSWMTGFNKSFRRLVFWFISYSYIFLGVLGSMDPKG